MFKFLPKNFRQLNTSLSSSLGAFQRRSLHTKVLGKLDNGTFIAELRNDLKTNEGREKYNKRSWQTIKAVLEADMFYMYIDKAAVSNQGFLYAGHIASFLTNPLAKLIEESFMSLRNGDLIPNKTLKYKLHNDKEIRENSVWKVKFLESKPELENYFFDRAYPDIPKEEAIARYLIGIPIANLIPLMQEIKELYSIQEVRELLVARVSEVKEQFEDAEYILCDGHVGDELVKSLNCVTGFYESLSVQGTEPNPSPQMAAWSYLKLLFGELVRDELIEETKLREPGKERAYDDNLEIKEIESEDDYTYKP